VVLAALEARHGGAIAVQLLNVDGVAVFACAAGGTS
jgi:hypothetical protein